MGEVKCCFEPTEVGSAIYCGNIHVQASLESKNASECLRDLRVSLNTNSKNFIAHISFIADQGLRYG